MCVRVDRNLCLSLLRINVASDKCVRRTICSYVCNVFHIFDVSHTFLRVFLGYIRRLDFILVILVHSVANTESSLNLFVSSSLMLMRILFLCIVFAASTTFVWHTEFVYTLIQIHVIT